MSKSALSLGLVFLLAACGGTPTATESTAPTSPTTAASSVTPTRAPTATKTPPATGTEIAVGSSDFGTMLFDARGQAIYIWEVESTAEAECYDDCAALWPPVLTDGAPVAGAGVRGALLGTTERTDGTTQVTYNDHPLYFYAHEGPGEVECHNVATHGGRWWVVTPEGDRAA